ncbi:MAG: hypothetical protein ACYC9J_14435 [Sulfuricaulis sp.]
MIANSAGSDIAATNAEKIVNDVKDQVSSTWYNTVRADGVSEKDAETICGTFVNHWVFPVILECLNFMLLLSELAKLQAYCTSLWPR